LVEFHPGLFIRSFQISAILNKLFLLFAAVAGALAVISGAMLAHTLRHHMPESALEVYEVAVRYQFYHVFAILTAGILSERFPGSWMNRAGSCFIAGILLFCGSLYLISALMTNGMAIPAVLGICTPLGGVGFIMGWISLSIAILKRRSS
jgi:uncharacterized membrane protein YgdD (TMEM256/DUF423 family)